MEENNRKGTSVFYAVVGIATLVVAIIGATFAYFSASATSGAGDIQGGTNEGLSTALSLKVTRELFGATTGDDEEDPTPANYNNLVPAIIDVTPEGLKKVVDEKCVNGGYTGCHLYKIEAQSTQTLNSASIRLADLQTTATDYANWKYVLYSSADGKYDTITSIIEDAQNAKRSFAAYDENNTTDRVYTYVDGTISGFDMHNAASITANTPVYYYLLIYLANTENSQNPEDTTSTNSGTGTYTGIVTMDAAGGKVVASFSTTVSP